MLDVSLYDYWICKIKKKPFRGSDTVVTKINVFFPYKLQVDVSVLVLLHFKLQFIMTSHTSTQQNQLSPYALS